MALLLRTRMAILLAGTPIAVSSVAISSDCFIMLSVILTVVQMVFGINFGTMAGSNLNLGTLFIFAMVVGFSGSIISLLASKMMAKMTMGLTMIDVNNPRNRVEQYVVETVRKLARAAKDVLAARRVDRQERLAIRQAARDELLAEQEEKLQELRGSDGMSEQMETRIRRILLGKE